MLSYLASVDAQRQLLKLRALPPSTSVRHSHGDFGSHRQSVGVFTGGVAVARCNPMTRTSCWLEIWKCGRLQTRRVCGQVRAYP